MIFLKWFTGLLIILTSFYKWFHRVPLRSSSASLNEIIAPADGVIWQIIYLENQEAVVVPKQFLGKIQTIISDIPSACWLVSIFMSPLDCHVNWSPVDAKITNIAHTAGNFFFANTWKSLFNEKNEIILQNEQIKLKMIQIAGFVARRIEFWKSSGERVSRGEPVGMIRLGSQVTLILPRNVELTVKQGQKIRGGETVIAKITS